MPSCSSASMHSESKKGKYSSDLMAANAYSNQYKKKIKIKTKLIQSNTIFKINRKLYLLTFLLYLTKEWEISFLNRSLLSINSALLAAKTLQFFTIYSKAFVFRFSQFESMAFIKISPTFFISILFSNSSSQICTSFSSKYSFAQNTLKKPHNIIHYIYVQIQHITC